MKNEQMKTLEAAPTQHPTGVRITVDKLLAELDGYAQGQQERIIRTIVAFYNLDKENL